MAAGVLPVLVAELLWLLAGLVSLLALTGWVCQRFRLPPALGYLLVGVALPKGLTDTSLQEVIHLEEASRIAVLILLFFIGMELDVRTLRKVLHETRVVSLFNILVPALLVTGLARLLGWPPVQALVLGIALSLSSTIFGELLSSGRRFPTVARRRMFGVLLAEDVAAGALLGFLAVLAGSGTGGTWFQPIAGVVGLLVSLLVLAALAILVVPRIMDRVAVRHSQELTILTSGAFLFVLSAAGGWAGSAELGAFLAGMAAAEAGSRFVVRNALSGVRSISLALFFFASGLIVDPLVAFAQWPLVVACVVVVVVAKLLVHVPASLGKGLGVEDSLRVGFGMSTVGEFSLILALAAQNGGIAHPALFATVTGTIVGLLVAAPLLTLMARPLALRLSHSPKAVVRPVYALFQALRREKSTPRPKRPRAGDWVRLAAAVIVVGVIFAAAFTLNQWLPRRFPTARALYLSVLVYGLAFAVAAPFAYQLFRSYRVFMHGLLGVAESAAGGTDRLKLRVADAASVLLLLLLAVPLSFLLGGSPTVVLGSLLLATLVAVIGWRQLTNLTEALEATVARVLGSEADMPVLLDQAIGTYGWDFRVAAINLPHDSRLVGQTLGEVRLRQTTGAMVAVIKRGAREIVNPPVTERFRSGDTLVLMGDPGQLARAEALLEAGEAPLRMAAESRAAAVEAVEIEPDSWLTLQARPRREVEEATGALILGEWHQGTEHPGVWRDEHQPIPGDRIIVLGTPLQLERVRRVASRPEISEEGTVTSQDKAPE